MPTVSWDYAPKVRKFQRAILSKGRERGIADIGPTKMLGLLYLLDVEHMVRYGEQATEVVWTWAEYGPFDSDAAYQPRTDSAVSESAFSGPYEGSVYQLIGEETFDLEQKIDDVLSHVFAEVGKMGGSQIKRHCYQNTEPMRRIEETGRRGDPLDMSLARKESKIDSSTAKGLKDIVDAVGSSSPNANTHTDEFVEVVREGSELRKRATTRLLDGS